MRKKMFQPLPPQETTPLVAPFGPPPPPPKPPVEHTSLNIVAVVLASIAVAASIVGITLAVIYKNNSYAGAAGAAGARGPTGPAGPSGSITDPTASFHLTYTGGSYVDVAMGEATMPRKAPLQIHRASSFDPGGLLYSLAFGIDETAVSGFTTTAQGVLKLCGPSTAFCKVWAVGSTGQLILNYASTSTAAGLTINGTGFVPTRADNTFCATRGTPRVGGVYTCYKKDDLTGSGALAGARFINSNAVLSMGPDDRGRGVIQTAKIIDPVTQIPLLLNPVGGGVHINTEVAIAPVSGNVDGVLFLNGSMQADHCYINSQMKANTVAAVASMSAPAVNANSFNGQQISNFQNAVIGSINPGFNGPDTNVLTVNGNSLMENIFYSGQLISVSDRRVKTIHGPHRGGALHAISLLDLAECTVHTPGADPNRVHLCLFADSVKQHLPFAHGHNAEVGLDGIDHYGMISYLVAAVQEMYIRLQKCEGK
jgi:hypothetical protein